MKTIYIDGMTFTQSGRKYYYNSNNRIYLHRYIWEKINGPIPEGFEIHHIDGDAENNSLENLIAMDKTKHKELHGRDLTDEQREWLRRNLAEKARPEANRWHKSEVGREWHKENYESMKHKLHQREEFECENCGGSFEAQVTGANRFCSNKCKAKWRRDSGIDNELRTCVCCGNDFEVNKYKKNLCCSKSCSMKKRHADRGLLKDSPNSQE